MWAERGKKNVIINVHFQKKWAESESPAAESESFAAWGECVYWCTAGLSVVNSVATGNCIVNSCDKLVALFLDRTARYTSHGRGSCSSRRALWPEIRASSVCASCALSSLAEQSVNPTFPVNTTCDWTVRQQTAKHWPRAEGPPSRLFFKLRVCEASFSLSLSFRVSEQSCVTTLPQITWVASSQLCGRISAKWVL